MATSNPAPSASRRMYQDFGRALRDARVDAGLTQEALGYRVGLSRTSITNIEKGNQPVALHTLIELARALRVSPVDLLPVATEPAEHVLPKELIRDWKGNAEVTDWLHRVVGSTPRDR